MANINNLIVFKEARELVRFTAQISKLISFGDLANQMQRASVSVASNICEGAGSGTEKQFARYLRIARGSVNETHCHLLLAADMGYINEDHDSIQLADRIGKRLTTFIKKLDPG